MGDGGGTVSPGSTKAENKTNDDQFLCIGIKVWNHHEKFLI